MEMASSSKHCMNALCGASTSSVWRKGWGLRSGEVAILCDNCGLAYEQSIFCEVFHPQDSGWRECASCGKRLHCGCIASRFLVELQDDGGISCLNCFRQFGANTVGANKKPNGFVKSRIDGFAELQSLSAENGRMGASRLLQLHGDDINASFRQMKQQFTFPKMGETGSTSFSHFEQGKSIFSPPLKDIGRAPIGAKDLYESLGYTSLSMESNNGTVSPVRIARLPRFEGRGKCSISRYSPRITDQELRRMSTDPNFTVRPLFEKVLSASDAGRIGRLVLPKACAEEYFPRIDQPEGRPLSMQDVNGKEWMFQYRYWPNNNSRMYVLEGVTSCIQSMQLEAGDIVTFSRMESKENPTDPEGKLIMGFRKATTPTTQGSSDAHFSTMSKHLKSTSGDNSWHKSDKQEKGLMQPSTLVPEKKRARNIGTKGKRLLIASEDASELKLTWEEVQDLLRPAPTSKPNIVTIDDYEFEEYDEPPVFGKTSIFVAHSTGQEQWTECDNCSKWRKLPVDFLLPPTWTCSENTWDESRCSCSAPDELTPKELENLLIQNKDQKKRRLTAELESERDGLETLANAVFLGADAGEETVATTTKHPRHRPGCSCIVCIQPPSGKGKHKPTCTCNVCSTVKRRFETLQKRKKKRLSDREAERAAAEMNSQQQSTTTVVEQGESSSRSKRNKSTMVVENGKGHIDLNFYPDREEDSSQAGVSNQVTTMLDLLQAATSHLLLDNYRNFNLGVQEQEIDGEENNRP
ncbi:B3 domain-containing transcription repressor VAL2 [Linum grandiflorum]